MIMQTKISFVLVVLFVAVQSKSIDLYDRLGGPALDSNSPNNGGDTDQVKDKNAQPSKNTHDRYSPQDSSSDGFQSQPHQSSSYEDDSNLNNWSPYEHGLNSMPMGMPVPSMPSPIFQIGTYPNSEPSCFSLLDPQYPLFADVCGALPQARYSLPNSFGHLERWQIAQVLTSILGSSTPAAKNPVCTRSLRLLLCPLLFPPCPTRDEPPAVVPCQPFCRMVKSQCATPSLDLLPCDYLPPMSEICPINPTPYSSLLSSYAQAGMPNPSMPVQAGRSTLFSPIPHPSMMSLFGYPSMMPPTARSSMFPPSFYSPMAPPPSTAFIPTQRSTPASPPTMFYTEPYMINSLKPILMDLPPLNYANSYGQGPQ